MRTTNILMAGLLSLTTAVAGLPSASGTSPATPDLDARHLSSHRRESIGSTVSAREAAKSVFPKIVSKRSSVPTLLDPSVPTPSKRLVFIKRYYYGGQPQSVRPTFTPADKAKYAANHAMFIGTAGARPCGGGCQNSVLSAWSRASQAKRPHKTKRSLKGNGGPVEKRMADDDEDASHNVKRSAFDDDGPGLQ